MLLATALTLLVAAPPVPAAPAPAAQAVQFDTVSDKTFVDTVLTPRRGKTVLVNFWASYCLPCLEEMPALLELQKQRSDVEIVFVDTDPVSDTARVAKFLQRKKIALARSYIVENDDPEPFIKLIDAAWQGELPYTVVYDKNGVAAKKLTGLQSKASFEAALPPTSAPASASTP